MEFKIDESLFNKYKEYKPTFTGTLFGIDLLDAVVKHVCPYCGNKLYPMRKRPFMYCKGKKHINKFIIGKDKLK